MVDWLRNPFHADQNYEGGNEPFFKNTGKKLFALIIAIALWLVANLQYDIEKNISIDVDYTNLPPGLILANNPPAKLNLRVIGPRSQLSSITPQNFVFTIDLSNVATGMSKFEIRTDQINPPQDVQVTGISPAEIKVDVERLIQKKVDVTPSIAKPDTGYELVGKPEISPNRIRIQGPESLLEKVKSVSTDLVSLKGEKSQFSIEAPVRSPYSLVSIVGNNTVKVTVDIKEKTLEKEFNNLDISFINFDDFDFETKDNIVTELAFEGPFSIINELNSDDITLIVDGNNIAQSKKNKTHKLKIDVKYPHKELLKLTKQSPKTIEVKIN